MKTEFTAQIGVPVTLEDKFFLLLMEDVMRARQRLKSDDGQASRRDFVRTSFAAIEGAIWEYREHVRTFLNDIGENTPLTESALAEASYEVSVSGKILAKTRHIALPVMFRMVTRLAEQSCAELSVDFSGRGWPEFQKAIKVRNRVTHPKRASDLEISNADVATSEAGFFWMYDTILAVMGTTNARSREYLIDLRAFTAALQARDPAALALYEKARIATDSAE